MGISHEKIIDLDSFCVMGTKSRGKTLDLLLLGKLAEEGESYENPRHA